MSFTQFLLLFFFCSLFLTTSLFDLQALFQLDHISPQNASTLAVSGFWQLVRVALLNFSTLAGVYFFSRYAIWDFKIGKMLLSLLFTYSLIFAALAAWKLFGIYIFLFGVTPLRLISGWFITVLIFGTILTLIRLHKNFHSVRLGLLYVFISFSCLPYLFALFIK